MPARKRSDIDWDQIRQDVTEGKGITQIAKQHGVDRKSIRDKQKSEGWDQELDDNTQMWLARVAQETLTAKWIEADDHKGIQLRSPAARRTPGNAALILTLVEKGSSPSLAAQSIGVSPSTLSTWRDEDPHFNEMIGEASARPLSLCEVNIARIGAASDWKASERFLAADKRTKAKWQDAKTQSDNGITVTITSRDGDEIKVTTSK